MNVANKADRAEKLAPPRGPGLWINPTGPDYYTSGVSVLDEQRTGQNGESVFVQGIDEDGIAFERDLTGKGEFYDTDADGRVIRVEREALLPPGHGLNWSCTKGTKEGDLSLIYRTTPAMDIRYLWQATSNAEPDDQWKYVCDFKSLHKFQRPLSRDEIRGDPFLKTHLRIKNPAVFRGKRALSPQVWRRLNEMLAELNPSYPAEVRENFGIDIFAGIPSVAAASSVVVPARPSKSPDENSDAVSMDAWAASPATYERVTRPQQRKFREKLIRAYNGRCAVTGESTDVVLEAAHLPGRDHTRHNRARDGILLRIDLHRLLDKGLMTFTAKGVVQIAAEVGPEYRKFHGRKIRFPKRKADRPAFHSAPGKSSAD